MSDAPHTRTGYTTVDPSEGEQAKPCYPDPVMDAVRRCAEIAREVGNFGDYRREELTADFGQPRYDMMYAIINAIEAEFGLLPTSET